MVCPILNHNISCPRQGQNDWDVGPIKLKKKRKQYDLTHLSKFPATDNGEYITVDNVEFTIIFPALWYPIIIRQSQTYISYTPLLKGLSILVRDGTLLV